MSLPITGKNLKESIHTSKPVKIIITNMMEYEELIQQKYLIGAKNVQTSNGKTRETR